MDNNEKIEPRNAILRQYDAWVLLEWEPKMVFRSLELLVAELELRKSDIYGCEQNTELEFTRTETGILISDTETGGSIVCQTEAIELLRVYEEPLR